MKRKKEIKNNRKLILTISSIILGLLVLFLIYQYFFNYVDEEIQSECGVVYGRLINGIRDENDCEQRCRVRCDAVSKDFRKSEFESVINSCNICNCQCR